MTKHRRSDSRVILRVVLNMGFSLEIVEYAYTFMLLYLQTTGIPTRALLFPCSEADTYSYINLQ